LTTDFALRQKHLADGLHLGKPGEDQPNRLTNAQVGIHFDFVAAYFYIANGYREVQLAPSCLLLQGFHRTGPQERRSSSPSCPAIAGRSDGVGSYVPSSSSVPVASIARQARRLDRKHGTNAAFTDRCKQPLESRTADARTRATKIVINDCHMRPAESSSKATRVICLMERFDSIARCAG
jgi:hypothetical protein